MKLFIYLLIFLSRIINNRSYLFLAIVLERQMYIEIQEANLDLFLSVSSSFLFLSHHV